MLIEGGTLQLRKVEANGRGRVLVLAEQFMAGEVVAGKSDEVWRRYGAGTREDLCVDMAREMLDTDFAKPSF